MRRFKRLKGGHTIVGGGGIKQMGWLVVDVLYYTCVVTVEVAKLMMFLFQVVAT